MTNRRLSCRISSDRIFDWYLRLIDGLEPDVDASAGDSEEGLYDSEGQDIESDGDSCLLYTSPSPRDRQKSRMPSSA